MKYIDAFLYKDGELFNKTNRSRKAKKGERSGFIDTNGYTYIGFRGTMIKAHRIIWEMHYGGIPKGCEIDHINGDRNDNRLENLRMVTRSENAKNKALNKNNKSGVSGVFFSKKLSSWVVKCSGEYIGCYKSFPQACESRIVAEVSRGYHPNHGRKL